MVTLKIEEVLLKSPVKENNLIKIYGQIDRIGGKSITVSVEARKFHRTAMKKRWCAAHASFLSSRRRREEHPHRQSRAGKASRQVRVIQ